MYIAIDIIIVVVMAACIIGAVKNGFIVTLFKLLSAIVALAVAFMFYGELGQYFNEKFVYSATEKYVVDFVADISADSLEALDVDSVMENLPEGVRTAVDMLGIDVADMLNDTVDVPSVLAEQLTEKISGLLSGVLAFAALFFGSLIILSLACIILNAVSKLPVLNGANKLLGFVFGVVEALVLGMVIANVAAALCGAYGAIDEAFVFTKVAENTYVAKFLISICPW